MRMEALGKAAISTALLYCLLSCGVVAAQDVSAQDVPVQDVAVQVETTPPTTGLHLSEPALSDTKPADSTANSVPDALKTSSVRPTAGISLGKMALSLGIVVAIVLVLGWLFKKLTLRLPGSRHIKIISTLALGQKERLLVIEMQGKQRVIGVTAHSVNFLFDLENPLPEEKLASDFHTQLQSLLKK